MDFDKKRAKLLKKYMETETDTKNKRNKQLQGANVLIRDFDDIEKHSHSAQQSEQQHPIDRQDSKTKNQQNTQYHETKMHKKLKRAFGGENDEQIQNFMQSVKIEGMEEEQLNEYLKKNRAVKIEIEKQKKIKKQKKKKKKRVRVSSSEDQKDKQQIDSKEEMKRKMFGSDQSSDLQIPRNSRTVFRNKDGTIKEKSDKKMKEEHQQKVLDRLAQWQQGMKKQQDHDSDQDVARAKQQVFDDPMRRWDKQQFIKPLQCKYLGYTNRFNIKPGYRWDGVIRGNGFQTKYLQQQNLKKLQEDQKNKQYLKNL